MKYLIVLVLVNLTLGQTPPGPCGPFTKEDASGFVNKHPGAIECSVSDIPDASSPLNAVVDPNLLWPGGVSHYVIGSEYSQAEIDLIEAGINDLVTSTMVDGQPCIQILPRTLQTDYIDIGKNGGCSSHVGREGGRQDMSLEDSCVTRHGTIMHEFLHAYGFYHEQSRSDRDDWVWVNYDNIEPGREHNFRKYEPDEINLLGTSYAYNSVLHYSPYGFAIDDTIPTIYTCDPDAMDIIGQREALDALDIERVQILYNCITPRESKYFKHLDY